MRTPVTFGVPVLTSTTVALPGGGGVGVRLLPIPAGYEGTGMPTSAQIGMAAEPFPARETVLAFARRVRADVVQLPPTAVVDGDPGLRPWSPPV